MDKAEKNKETTMKTNKKEKNISKSKHKKPKALGKEKIFIYKMRNRESAVSKISPLLQRG